MSKIEKYVPFAHIPRQYALPTGDEALTLEEIIERGARAIFFKEGYGSLQEHWEKAKEDGSNGYQHSKVLAEAFVEEFVHVSNHRKD